MNEPALSDAFHEELLAAIRRGDGSSARREFNVLMERATWDGIWVREAGFWAARGALDDAECLFESVRSGDSKDSIATLALALCAQARGDYPKAEGLCLDVLIAAPEDPRPLEILADLYCNSGLASETERCLLRLAELLPQPARAWIALGNLYLACRAGESAASAFEKALAIEEDSADALLGVSLMHQLQGEIEPAKEKLKILIERRPDEPRAILALGFVHVLEKSPQLAHERFLAASERGAPAGMVQLGLAQVALLRCQYEEAWRLAAPLVQGAPGNVQVLCAAWSAAAGAGYTEEASDLRGRLALRVPEDVLSSLGV